MAMYDPRNGPPNYAANGRGTAQSMEEFEEQKRAFGAYNRAAGLTDENGGNIHSYGAGMATPQQQRDAADVPGFREYTGEPVTDYVPGAGPTGHPAPGTEGDWRAPGSAASPGIDQLKQGGDSIEDRPYEDGWNDQQKKDQVKEGDGTTVTNGQGYKPTAFQRPSFAPPPPPPPPAAPPAAPDFMDMVQMPDMGELPQFQAPGAPEAAPDFQGAAEMDPYAEPDNAYLGEDLYGDLKAYASDWMATPNRYLSDLATQTREVGEARLREAEKGAVRDLEEWASGRGLVGGNYEDERRMSIADAQQRARGEQELQLLEMMAGAETADRQAAGQFGLQAGEYARGLGADRRDEAHYGQDDAYRGAGLRLDAAQMEEQSNQFRSEFQLAVEQAGQDAAFRNVELKQRDAVQRADLALQAGMAGDKASMDRAMLALDQLRVMDRALLDRSALQLQSQEIDLRAWEILQDAELSGQRLGLDQARLAAEVELRKAELAQRKVEEENRDRREGERLAENARQHDDIMDSQYGGDEEPTPSEAYNERERIKEGRYPANWNVWSEERRFDYLLSIGFDANEARERSQGTQTR